MNTSRLGLFDQIDLPHPLPPQEAVEKIRWKIGIAADALQRMLDGLARDDAATIDWDYVCKQAAVAIDGSLHAGLQADAQGPKAMLADAAAAADDSRPSNDPFLPSNDGSYDREVRS